MRTVLILMAATLAGCTVGSDVGGQAFEVRILYDERATFYTGDVVELEAVARGAVVSWTWDLGDGTSLAGREVQHVYDLPGDQRVTVEAVREDGATAQAEAVIQVLDLFGGTAPPAGGAPPLPPSSGVANLALAAGEPTTGQAFEVQLQGPTFLGAGEITVWVGDEPLVRSFDGLPATLELPPLEAGRHQVSWLASFDDEEEAGLLVFDVWGLPIEFGEPSQAQWLRPGIHSSVCTTNFLFHYKWYRFFVGSAAHCVDDLDIEEVCHEKPTGRIGQKETLQAHDSTLSTKDVWVAYHSWITMDRVGERDAAVCRGNDFALLELGPQAQEAMHPAALFYGGPTALAPASGYAAGTLLYGYGASNLHGNVGVGYPGQEAVNRKLGLSLGPDDRGYAQHLLFAVPAVPGDSGGPAFGPGGEALGAASTLTLAPTPGTNRYTNVAKALEYMELHEGWAPELVTHDSWSTTGT